MVPLEIGLLALSLVLYATGALLSGLTPSRMNAAAAALSMGGAVGGAAAGLVLSSVFLIAGAPFSLRLPLSLPFGPLTLKLDGLSAFFLFLISLLALMIALFSFGYLKEYRPPHRVGRFGFQFNLLLISLVGVVLAADAVAFLIAWESTALLGYLLVSYEEKAESVRAGNLYLVMSHAGTALILVSFFLLIAASGGIGFDSFRAARPHLTDGARTAIFLSALIGFGVKAGLIPLHIWLPAAHPAAPSNVSALLSAVIIKMGIYGMARFFFDFLGPGPIWWGGLLLFLASLSALLGVMYALMEHDLKRLLAFHSIENIGIILIGFGAAMIFASFGRNAFSALALAAALYHTLNHAVFKGLLFLGAGAVVSSTHTKNMEEMGGLIHRMPMTAFFFLIGSISISALPPFNGFVSEWLTFQSLLLSLQLPGTISKILISLSGAMLALTGALAAACFVKAFGITFLAAPRGARAGEAKEASLSMRLGMGGLALACLLLGLFAGGMVSILDGVTFPFAGAAIADGAPLGGWSVISAPGGFSSLSPAALALALAASACGGLAIALWIGGRRAVRVGETWACGIPDLNPRMEYTATGFSKSFRTIFGMIYRPKREVKIRRDGPYIPREVTYTGEIEYLVEKYLYDPFMRGTLWLGNRIKVAQSGSIHAYLAYLFAILVLGLLVIQRLD